jgi:hypothetical protein
MKIVKFHSEPLLIWPPEQIYIIPWWANLSWSKATQQPIIINLN